MSCGVSELVIEHRPSGGAGVGSTASAGCRMRGSNSNATSPKVKNNKRSSVQAPADLQSEHLRPTKPCCFCWCCCCSCSCLTFKKLDENGSTKPTNNSDFQNCDAATAPTVEEIRSWGKSFETLMRSSAGRDVFRDFLRCEYSEENILFWLACEELKKETTPDVIEEKARKIYEDYISVLSPKEVSLDSRVREIVNRNMVEPTPHTFDEAQLQIYTLMHRDSYPRFVNSNLFKTSAQLNSDTGAASDNSASSANTDANAVLAIKNVEEEATK